jgi:hypothetical protein
MRSRGVGAIGSFAGAEMAASASRSTAPPRRSVPLRIVKPSPPSARNEFTVTR